MNINQVANTQLEGTAPAATDDLLNDFYGYVDDLVGTFEDNDNGLAFFSEDPNNPTLDPHNTGDLDSQLMIFNLKHLLNTGPSGAATSDFMTALNYAMNQTTNLKAQTIAKNLNTILTTPYQFAAIVPPSGSSDPSKYSGRTTSLIDMCKEPWVWGMQSPQADANWGYIQQMIADVPLPPPAPPNDNPIFQLQDFVGSIAKVDHQFTPNSSEEKLMSAIAKFNTNVKDGKWLTAASCVVSFIVPALKALPSNDPIAQEVLLSFCIKDTYGNQGDNGSTTFNRWRYAIQGDGGHVYSGYNSIEEIANLVVAHPDDATLAANFGHLLTNDDGQNALRGAGDIGAANFGSWAGMLDQMVTFYENEWNSG